MENSKFWGEWNFSSESQTKIDSLCLELSHENKDSNREDEVWDWLVNQVNHYTQLKKPPETHVVTEVAHVPDETSHNEEPMEISLQSDSEELVDIMEQKDVGSSKTVEDSINLLLTALDSPDTNNINISVAIKDISNSDLISVIQGVWIELSTDSSRLCFCGQLIGNSKTSIILCEYILLPWLSEGKCSCIEPISEMLPHFIDVACKTLILPLLASEDSPFVLDIFILKDLTAHLQADHWVLILCEFVRSINSGLKKWHLPVIVVGVENSKGARRNILDEVLNNLVVLMSCHVRDFVKDRDFGNIMIAVINCLSVDSSSFFIKQLSDLAQSYTGPLRKRRRNLQWKNCRSDCVINPQQCGNKTTYCIL